MLYNSHIPAGNKYKELRKEADGPVGIDTV
ncbi:hypothetical protein BH11BAC7_BH11BAC7_03840 [soil metagenome]